MKMHQLQAGKVRASFLYSSLRFWVEQSLPLLIHAKLQLEVGEFLRCNSNQNLDEMHCDILILQTSADLS